MKCVFSYMKLVPALNSPGAPFAFLQRPGVNSQYEGLSRHGENIGGGMKIKEALQHPVKHRLVRRLNTEWAVRYGRLLPSNSTS